MYEQYVETVVKELRVCNKLKVCSRRRRSTRASL
jgi:hypothetical protein